MTEDEYREGIFEILDDPLVAVPVIYDAAVDVAVTRGWAEPGRYQYTNLPPEESRHHQELLLRKMRGWAKIDAHEEGDCLVDDRVRGGVDAVGSADDDGAPVPDRVVGAGAAVRGDGEPVAGGADGTGTGVTSGQSECPS